MGTTQILLDHCFLASVQMSPFLLAFFKLFQWRLHEGNDLVDISVDFRTTERVSITQEGN